MKMLNPSGTTYFSLLRQAIYQGAKCAVYGVQGSDIIHIALRQGTALLIADQLLKQGAECPMQGELKALCYQNIMLQQEMRHALKQVWPALEASGIHPVLMKGFGLSALYPQPHLRQWGDIDIYVGKDGYHRAAEVLRKIYPNSWCFEAEEEYYKHWNIDVESTAIEAHRISVAFQHPKDNKIWHVLENEAMGDDNINDNHNHNVVDIDGLKVRVPEAKFNVLFVFLHSWHHFTESRSAKMQQLCDLALLLRGTDPLECALEEGKHVGSVPVMETYLRRNLRRLRLTAVWQQYAYIMVKYLGLPKEKCPLYVDNKRIERKAEMLLQMILARRPQREHPMAPKWIIARKMYSLRIKIADSLSLWPISSAYAIHDIIGKLLNGAERLIRGEMNRKWE